MTGIEQVSLEKTVDASGTQNIPPPVIEWPKEGIEHDGVNVRCAGTCLEGAVVEILFAFTWEPVPAIGTNWCITLNNVGPGARRIQVRQTLDGVVSNPAEERNFHVRKPSSVAAPMVTAPAAFNSFAAVGDNVLFSGPHVSGEAIYIRDVDDTLLGTGDVDGAFWYFSHSWEEAQISYVKITKVVNNVVSHVTERWIGIGLENNKLKITITNPPNESVYAVGGYADFTGICTPTSNTRGDAYVGIMPPYPMGNVGHVIGNRWYVRLGPLSRAGRHFLYVIVTDGHERRISGRNESLEIGVVDAGENPHPPLLMEPRFGDRFFYGDVVVAEGLCEVGATVEVFDYRGSWSIEAEVVGNKWSASLMLGRGTHLIAARQTKDGLVSPNSGMVQFAVD
ncbi:hypothetical protein C1886_19225 [Pseudomonas sp. FW300-N1A1]|uniref:hypothetical protein n=1 Tax=Pseudomonas sp. FW300-N1A1 TaxID=2075555 RepID=UPI000CCFF939|nr:hypothetical protein [Pseudomonas sp. FW300-N1A1]POA17978.1 hypothetical protein C1886_19225 [Pseudomonas sp. FW300-N1A1]